MGVPKFFRWISERYPKINCPLHCPPFPETRAEYFPHSNNVHDTQSNELDPKEYAMKTCLVPEFDRLYLDMNGIIHCASHNNASELNTAVDPDVHIDSISNANPEDNFKGCVEISEEEIFRNVAYYLDRIVCDIVQPKELVFLSIDGVAPRAKMNQQRGRRYRSGQETEIEHVFYKAMEQQKSNNADDSEEDTDDFLTHPFNNFSSSDKSSKPSSLDFKITEVEPGRLAGKYQTSNNEAKDLGTSHFDLDFEEYMRTADIKTAKASSFHSNSITPGTEFFESFTLRLEDHLRKKLECDSRWAHLTIILSGPRVPGEGEHKIMDFIRREKLRKDYNRNTRHCLYGQDGDLIMLGLTTHEPNFCLLREEVIFDQARRRRMQLAQRNNFSTNQDSDQGVNQGQISSSILMNSIDSYVNNSSFELLHMSVLRDYIAYEFETKDVVPENSPFELEPTIDDFVFMTFFVGNDFLPHMPALDIQDEAFELLFYAYKRNRHKWVLGDDYKEKDTKENLLKSDYPYLTRAGEIVSGARLESFLRTIGTYENPYYDNKKRQVTFLNERIRAADEKAGRDLSVPSAETLAAKEAFHRSNYKTMLQSIVINNEDKNISSKEKALNKGHFVPVTSNSYLLGKVGLYSTVGDKKIKFKPDVELDVDEGLISKMGSLIKNSLAPNVYSSSNTTLIKTNRESLDELIDRDTKGRYYFEKFNISPIDQKNHLKLRQSYIEGLVWTLAYYYKGCQDWEWFFPYHYGPMLSDLVNIESLLKNSNTFSADKSGPLKPFEQLMACLPPSSSYLLPKPFQWLMRSPKSPIKEFYPDFFTVDFNGKRWPWEAVVLLPFIDSQRLVQAVQNFVSVDQLTSSESKRNVFREDLVFARDTNVVTILKLNDTKWGNYRDYVFDNTYESPVLTKPGFATLRGVPVQSLIRRKVGINVFGMKSRYKTAVLQLDSVIPQVPGARILAGRFIGTTVFYRYPFFHEGYVTAVSDHDGIVRGKEGFRVWSSKEKEMWVQRNRTLVDQCETGEGITGSGGCNIFDGGNCIFYIRPLKSIRTLANGSKVKVYARVEVDVPIVACLWSPTHLDSRLIGLPALLEKNPFQFGPKLALDRLSSSLQSQKIPGRFHSTSRALYSSLSSRPFVGLCETVKVDSTQSSLSRGQFLPSRRCIYTEKYNLRANQSNLSIYHSIRRTHGTKSLVALYATIAYYTFFYQGSNEKTPFFVHGETGLLSKMKAEVFPSLRSPFPARSYDSGYQHIQHGRQLTPPLEFAHGTTTISFTFNDGIIAAVDSRASIGNFVGSKTTKKVLEVNAHILGTMAGGAADCSFWIRKLQSEAKYYAMAEGKSMTVARASKILANSLYRNRGADLSIGTMIMGFDDHSGPSIYYVDSRGVRTFGDVFAVGSGATFAISILDTDRRKGMPESEAIALGIKAIRYATFRDAYSGGYIGVYVIDKHGWRNVFSEDIAVSTNSLN